MKTLIMNTEFISRVKCLSTPSLIGLFFVLTLMQVKGLYGQNVYFGDNWVQMNTMDGENFILQNFTIDDFGNNVYFVEDPSSIYYFGSNPISGVASLYSGYSQCELGLYASINYNRITHQYSLVASVCSDVSSTISISSTAVTPNNLCSDQKLKLDLTPKTKNWSYQWYKNGQVLIGADSIEVIANNSNVAEEYLVQATCSSNGQIIVSEQFTRTPCSTINYMLVQNVSVTAVNSTQGTAQVQFDLNWGNSWKDSINWDAAWVFMKYKNAAGEWKHAKINPTGYDHGIGTSNIIQPTSDKMGAFIHMADYGQTNFSVDGLQLQWNYGLDGVSNPANLELKVFAVEMVYIPIGSFSFCDGDNYKPKGLSYNYSVINQRISPQISVQEHDAWSYENFSDTVRIKGDAGLDSDNDGIIDHPYYPTGYFPFYAFKYEMSDQQYADFLNCLSNTQQSALEVTSGSSSLNFVDGKYYASSPNRAFSGEYNVSKLMLVSYADWSGLRPLSVLEFSKALWGSKVPYVSNSPGNYINEQSNKDVGYAARIYNSTSYTNGGSGYFGIKDMMCSLTEPCISLVSDGFSIQIHGDGQIDDLGNSDIQIWQNSNFVVHYITVPKKNYNGTWTYESPDQSDYSNWRKGIRLARSAE